MKYVGLEDNVNADVTNVGGKMGDAQDRWIQNIRCGGGQKLLDEGTDLGGTVVALNDRPGVWHLL